MASGRPSRWPTFAALAIALIALAVGLGGWFRPVPHNNQPPPKPTYTDQQIADAKAKVCAAFGKLDRAVGVLNARPKWRRRTAVLAVATSTRQVLDVFGGRYLSTHLDQEPATPTDLANRSSEAVECVSEAMVIGYLDGLITV